MSPIVRDRKGEYKKEIEDIKRKGFQRIKIDNQIYDIDFVKRIFQNERLPFGRFFILKLKKKDLQILSNCSLLQRKMKGTVWGRKSRERYICIVEQKWVFYNVQFTSIF